MIVFGIMGRVSPAECGGIDIEIHLDSDAYWVGDTLDGKIEITNTYPATIPVSFTVSLYHNNNLKRRHQTYIKTLFTGSTDFSFQSFLIPQEPFQKTDIGIWSIVISKLQAKSEIAGRATFKVKQ
jgi:hypothetical protein